MSPQASDNREAVRAVIESWAAAVRARDYDGILRNHSSDFVMFDVPPPFASIGLDEYRKTWDLFFGCNAGDIEFDIGDMVIEAGTDVAFAFARMQCLTPDASGGLAPLDFRLTLGLKKIDGQWTIAHEHHSVPADD